MVIIDERENYSEHNNENFMIGGWSWNKAAKVLEKTAHNFGFDYAPNK